MKRLAIVVLSLVTLFACGGGSNERAKTLTSPTPTAKTLTEAELKAALLTVSDLPTGFTTSPPDTSEDDGETPCNAKPVKDRSTADAEAQFQKSETGPFVIESIGLFATGTARSNFDEAVKSINCTTWKTKINDEDVTFRLSPLSFPKLGDDTYAIRASASDPLPVEIDLVFVLRGDIICLISTFGLGGTDSALTETIARKAITKLDANI